MSEQLRGQTTLWPGGVVTGAAGKSAIAYIGSQENITIYLKSATASTSVITIEVQPGARSAGRNAADASGQWYTLLSVDGTAFAFTLGTSAASAICLSNISASYLRLSSATSIDLLAIAEYDN